MSSDAVRRAATARSYLFAPGNQERLLAQAFTAGADAAVLDLEDAVPDSEKARARTRVAACLASAPPRPPCGVHVRVNGMETRWAEADIDAVVGPGLAAIRLPKAEHAEAVRQASAWIARAEERQRMPPRSVRLDLTLETALGVANARELAACDARIGSLVFGQADFLRDVGAELGPQGIETLHARSRLVIAARAAGLPPPVAGAYTRLRDPAGLREAALSARRLGFFGMSAIHPEQIAVIHAAFAPAQEEVRWAREVLQAYREAQDRLAGAARLADGSFVDRPIAERARRILSLAERITERGSDA